MDTAIRRLVTVVTEAGLEPALASELEARGLGYTVTDARGKGTRGRRASQWSHTGNVRIEIICDSETADLLVQHLHQRFFEHYAMILWIQDVAVLRGAKFG